ncbi:MAG: fatty acid desaturase family protein [bacterium]|nr:fatty acid desaturase family protein [bacterium]
MILGSSVIAVKTENAVIYMLAAIIIMARKQALAILAHDVTHHNFLANRALADLIGNLLLAFPFGAAIEIYREFHYTHHLQTGTDNDPEQLMMSLHPNWQMPKNKKNLAKLFVGDLLALNLGDLRRFRKAWSPIDYIMTRRIDALKQYPIMYLAYFIFSFSLFAALTVSHMWQPFILLWCLPSLTILPLLSRVRALGDHAALVGSSPLNISRNIIASPLERFFFFPCNISYHLVHHLYPSVPFYKLPALHAELMKDENYRSLAHNTYGVIFGEKSLLTELTCQA